MRHIGRLKFFYTSLALRLVRLHGHEKSATLAKKPRPEDLGYLVGWLPG